MGEAKEDAAQGQVVGGCCFSYLAIDWQVGVRKDRAQLFWLLVFAFHRILGEGLIALAVAKAQHLVLPSF